MIGNKCHYNTKPLQVRTKQLKLKPAHGKVSREAQDRQFALKRLLAAIFNGIKINESTKHLFFWTPGSIEFNDLITRKTTFSDVSSIEVWVANSCWHHRPAADLSSHIKIGELFFFGCGNAVEMSWNVRLIHLHHCRNQFDCQFDWEWSNLVNRYPNQRALAFCICLKMTNFEKERIDKPSGQMYRLLPKARSKTLLDVIDDCLRIFGCLILSMVSSFAV